MSKPTITKIWLGGLLVFVAGLVVAGIGVGLMLANGGSWTPALSGSGYNFVPRIDGYFWSTIWLIVAGSLVALVGGTAQLVALIGALINTYQLPDRTWFVVLLAGGLIGLTVGLVGFAAMLAYVIAGPEAHALESPSPLHAPPLAPPPPRMPAPPEAPGAYSERTGTLVPS
jgi:hypothetical protein